MSRSSLLLVLVLCLLFPVTGAYAAQTTGATRQTSSTYSAYQPTAYATQTQWSQPDLVSFAAGYDDFDKTEAKTQSADFRLEYRWGYSLWSAQTDWLNFGIHPLAGVEFSTRSQLYGFGGLGFDLLFWKHVVFTESEAVGFFDSGDARPLGSFIEFRSQAELGWRFDNDVRVTAAISHISNAGLTKHNPGEEIVGAYVHIPVGMLFGH